MATKRSGATPAEWDVLETLWREAPLSAREVFDRMAPRRAANPQTIRTLLDRLLAKNLVERRDAHGVWVFAPRKRRTEVVREESRNFLKRFFGGEPALGAAYFIEHEKLSPGEIRRLNRLLDEKSDGARP